MQKDYNCYFVTILSFASNFSNMRLDKYIQNNHFVPYSLSQKFIRSGFVKVNGLVQKDCGVKVTQSCVVDILKNLENGKFLHQKNLAKSSNNSSKIEKYKEIFSDLEKAIIFEDQNIIAINKPANLAVQGGVGEKYSLDDFLLYLYRKYPDRYQQKPKIVHRIDKQTKGIVIFAKSSDVSSQLSEMFKNHLIKKTYIAVVLTENISDTINKIKNLSQNKEVFENFKLASYIKKDGLIARSITLQEHKTLTKDEKSEYKLATTNCLVIGFVTQKQALDFHVEDLCVIDQKTSIEISQKRGFIVLKLNPLSGRNHQIRSQVKLLSCSIVGDFKYGFSSDEYLNNNIDLKLFATDITFDLLDKNYKISIL